MLILKKREWLLPWFMASFWLLHKQLSLECEQGQLSGTCNLKQKIVERHCNTNFCIFWNCPYIKRTIADWKFKIKSVCLKQMEEKKEWKNAKIKESDTLAPVFEHSDQSGMGQWPYTHNEKEGMMLWWHLDDIFTDRVNFSLKAACMLWT